LGLRGRVVLDQSEDSSRIHLSLPDPHFENWLRYVSDALHRDHPNLVDMFLVYSAEARYGRRFISASLSGLSKSSKILEVGAGVMLLSCQLVREGFRVTAVEPTGVGFSRFAILRKAVLKCAQELGCEPTLLEQEAETFESSEHFDFAFSINVMEHVGDVKAALNNIARQVKLGGEYRFTCPNYSFPYESHFNIPIIVSKKVTFFIFRKKIQSAFSDNPLGVWNSLNWISVRTIKALFSGRPGFKLSFGTDMLRDIVERSMQDGPFASRRTRLSLWVLRLMSWLQIHKVTKVFPAELHPLIDCTIKRVAV
jgi:2-polyprenyl-3-methyl-5-hydroxy-6-metoxy-1,4-benzoquinol methylase